MGNFIPRNTLLRDNAKKELKPEGYDCLIKKMDVNELQMDHHYRRRVNQAIKKRTESLLKGTVVSLEEAADLLDLINSRLIIDGFTLEEAEEKMHEMRSRFGAYQKRFTTTESFETDSDIFIEYTNIGKVITDKDYTSRKVRTYNERGY